MTQEQKSAIMALSRVTYLPGSADKRFARQMAERLRAEPNRPLTERQAKNLTDLLHRYRRQHRRCSCDLCRAVR